MRVLVSGHRGYIGSVLAPFLRDAGHDVVGLDADLYRGCDFGGHHDDGIPSLERDLRDVSARDLAGFDAVAHLAGLSNDPLGALDERLTYDINHRGSVRLAEQARRAGVERFVFSSSCSNYGAAGGDDLLDEEAELRPVTAYGRSKVLAERDLATLADDSFSPTFLRNATVYGVSSRLRLDIVVANLVAWAYTTGEVRLQSDGTPWRPLVHVVDVCRAFRAALEAPKERVHLQAFNVGGTAHNYRVRDIAEVIAETVPGSRVTLAPGASPDLRDYRVTCAKLERALGFEPSRDLRSGVREHYDAYRAAGLTLADVQGSRYQRLARSRELLDAGELAPDLRFTASAPARPPTRSD
jgi:nucleoside-diphosphate-sugar epimerase